MQTKMEEFFIEKSELTALKGQTVIVTGGSSGIGLATTELLLELGSNVVIGDQNEPPITHTNLSFAKTDVTSWSDLLSLFKSAVSKHARIDHVFANAGISGRAQYLEEAYDATTGDLLEPSTETYDINLRGMINTAYLGLTYLRRQKTPAGGSIVCTASASSFQRFRVADYTAAKHGVLGFVRGVVPNLTAAGSPIRVNAISPSWTRTGLVPEGMIEKLGFKSQGPEVVALSVAALMVDGKRQGQLIYSTEGRFFEIEETILLPAAKAVVKGNDDDVVMAAIARSRGDTGSG